MGWRLDKHGKWRRLSKSARANRAHLRRFILLGLYTGTRHSVLTKLLWNQSRLQAWVDLRGGVIYRRGADEKEQKTKQRPLVVLPARLIAHMNRWNKLDMEAERTVRTVLHHGGEPIKGKIRTGFASCVRDAGLDREITPHWLRHTAATWLMENGADAWEAAGYLGMTVATLEKNYGHRRPRHQANAVKAMTRGKAA
ncbi:tyrosine-type recombinase/integrase [Caulobacter sp. UC70_42]|uniref:tyrosine-type recombinase/integrase n=1 Tax=Caulobacter sp. UC70_42 TaxID=3374551 RepID=UPI003757F84A